MLRERFAEEYRQRRQHKGIDLERARDIVIDVSYFGTMMVEMGLADGMVSGAAHTTAHTIRPGACSPRRSRSTSPAPAPMPRTGTLITRRTETSSRGFKVSRM